MQTFGLKVVFFRRFSPEVDGTYLETTYHNFKQDILAG